MDWHGMLKLLCFMLFLPAANSEIPPLWERQLFATVLNGFQLSLLCYNRLQPFISRNCWYLYKSSPLGSSWASQPVRQAGSQSGRQSGSQPASQPASQPVSQSVNFLARERNNVKTFFNYIVKIEIKTTVAGLKNELKYSPLSDGSTCISEPNLEILLLRIIQ